MTKKSDREEFIRSKAMDLAETGRFPGWQLIEVELTCKGYDEARSAMGSSFFREQIDRACAAAIKRPG